MAQGVNMAKKHRESHDISKGSEKRIRFVTNTSEDKVNRLRRAYLDNQLMVESERLAEKMLTFERLLEITFPDKDIH